MEKIIEIDIENKAALLEKYNKEKASINLIEYIIKQAKLVDKKEKIKIVVNKDRKIEEDCKKLIINGLKDEYIRSKYKYHANNIKQIYLLILGAILLFISTRIRADVIWKEILLISGWVPIWEMVKIELFPDIEGRIKRRVIKKLLESEIIEKNIDIGKTI